MCDANLSDDPFNRWSRLCAIDVPVEAPGPADELFELAYSIVQSNDQDLILRCLAALIKLAGHLE